MIRIADPSTGAALPAGRVGEIQVSGPSVAAGYWNRSEDSEAIFRYPDAEGTLWLRSGDLGFELEGELYITGRLKELIIVRGRNLYPQDLEGTATNARRNLQPGSTAAFAIDHDGSEVVVLVCEVTRGFEGPREEIAAAVRNAVASEHEVTVHDVVLLAPGKLPRTTSGKIRRSHCRSQYLAGVWEHAAANRQAAMPDAAAGPVLEEISAAVSALLSVPAGTLRATTRLTSAGLDSLKSIELQHVIQSRWHVEISASDLLEGMTLGELGEKVTAGPSNQTEDSVPPAGPSHRLTPGQHALYTLESLAHGSSPNNLYAACHVSEPVSAEALWRAARRGSGTSHGFANHLRTRRCGDTS